MAFSTALLIGATLGGAIGAPAPSERVWKSLGSTEKNTNVTVTVQIHQPSEVQAELHRIFLAVSTPGSGMYGQHLSFEEMNELVRVPDTTVDAVREWCDNRGFTCTFTGTGDILRIVGSVAEIETELGVHLETFEHPDNGARIIRTRSYVAPSPGMASWADSVMGLNTFPTLARLPTSDVGRAPPITPALLKGPTLYNITESASASTKASMAVAEFQGQAFLPSDLAKFEEKFNLPSQKVRRVLGSRDADKSAGMEAELDIEYIIATGTGVPADFYLQSGNSFDLPGWASSVLADNDTALVWSVSYGEGINGGIGGVVQPDYANALNMQFEKMGARGISILIASGDSGVYNRQPFGITKFHPSFPACLPAATAVGSTELSDSGVEDTGVSFSGGGFTPAKYYTRAADATWQTAQVDAYLSSGVKLPPAELWDKTGRGLPDVSAVGVDYTCIINGAPTGVSGTSASTPAVAGIIALINDKLLADGEKPLGFLNPFLYQNPGAFRDIEKGYNNGGGSELFKKGFYATKGWDPVTGLGTPDYLRLKAAALKNARS